MKLIIRLIMTFIMIIPTPIISAFSLDHGNSIVQQHNTILLSQNSLRKETHHHVRSRKNTLLLFAADKDNNREPKKEEEENNNNNDEIDTSRRKDNSIEINESKLKEIYDRLIQLENFVSRQQVEIQHLKFENEKLTEISIHFAKMVEVLKQTGLEEKQFNNDRDTLNNKDNDQQDLPSKVKAKLPLKQQQQQKSSKVIEAFDDDMIFGTAPTSVMDAADAAGAAILAAMLGGKKHMIVDVRDAELSRDSQTLVQFIELAILPVAAGLEGLKSRRNRVKIVFPTVSQLLEYRHAMTLAAPEVVALSTLGFDPVEEQDKIVILVAPAPDDEEGLKAMNLLLEPTTTTGDNNDDNNADKTLPPPPPPITQPIVVVNYHMKPVSGPATKFEAVYHLRLLTVQYMSGSDEEDKVFQEYEKMLLDNNGDKNTTKKEEENLDTTESETRTIMSDDELLEAAMRHAREKGFHKGTTRAMIIRAYPKPWHVFLDTSPDTDADFEVAATFDQEPTQEEINYAIVECFEGSEREDEIVEQQMREALENGQLERLKGMILGKGFTDDHNDEDDEDNNKDENFYDGFGV